MTGQIPSDFKDDIDWGVYHSQQSPIAQKEGPDNYHQDVPLVSNKSRMVSTALGQMPRNNPSLRIGTPENKSLIQEMIGGMAGGGGLEVLENKGVPLVKEAASKAIDYLQPGKAGEKLRGSFGEGTSKENIQQLSQRAKFAAQSAKEEALMPKKALYAQEGKSDIYDVPSSNLPEGNVPKLAQMLSEDFTNAPMIGRGGITRGQEQSQINALSKALSDFRKGKVDKEMGGKPLDTFLTKAEEIFNVPELPEEAANKIEDVLSMPTKRDSKYFSDPNVTDAYSAKGKLMRLHEEFQNSPVLDNYDALQSALKKELRSMEKRAKVSDTAVPKAEQLQENIKNLDADKNAFTETLPDNLKELENQFRQKYKSYAEIYEEGKKETGASLTLRRLAQGRHDLVSDQEVVNLFSHPTVADKRALLDMGESAAKNAIYAALQKVPLGDAEGIAKTILDLKRTKGFDKIVTPEIEQQANDLLRHVAHVKSIKKAGSVIGGATVGALIGGPVGATIGATAPFVSKYIGKGLKYLNK